MKQIFLLFCLSAASVWAQGTTTIFGTVTDASGSVVPNIAVRAVRSETGASREVTADSRGDYIITQLPAGTYSVSVEAPGFKRFVLTGIAMQVDENRQVAIELQVGALADSVTVQAEAAHVEMLS